MFHLSSEIKSLARLVLFTLNKPISIQKKIKDFFAVLKLGYHKIIRQAGICLVYANRLYQSIYQVIRIHSRPSAIFLVYGWHIAVISNIPGVYSRLPIVVREGLHGWVNAVS